MPTEMIEYSHKLIKKEQDQLKDRVLELLTEYDDMAEEKKAIVKQYTDKLSGIAGELFDARTSLETGVQERTVRCDRVVDYEGGTVTLIDVITGDVRLIRSISEDESQIPLGIGDQAEYIKIMNTDTLPKKCAEMLGKIYKLESRQKEGKERSCYFKDESGHQRKIPLLHVELYNWEEVEELHPSQVIDDPDTAEEVENG